jgi:hypothetical protein
MIAGRERDLNFRLAESEFLPRNGMGRNGGEMFGNFFSAVVTGGAGRVVSHEDYGEAGKVWREMVDEFAGSAGSLKKTVLDGNYGKRYALQVNYGGLEGHGGRHLVEAKLESCECSVH